jgi:hypothetical protein
VVTVEVDGRDVATSNGAAANAPSPVWGQDLKIELEKADTVVLQVCDAKMVGEDNICGAHELDLKVLRNDNHPRRHKVDLKPTGILHIELRWDCKGKWDTLSTGFDCSHALHHGSVLVKYPRGSFWHPPRALLLGCRRRHQSVLAVKQGKDAAQVNSYFANP